jgi:hypothetical protein
LKPKSKRERINNVSTVFPWKPKGPKFSKQFISATGSILHVPQTLNIRASMLEVNETTRDFTVSQTVF